ALMVAFGWVMPAPDTSRPRRRSSHFDLVKSVERSVTIVNPWTVNVTFGHPPDTPVIVPLKSTRFDGCGGGCGTGVGFGAGDGGVGAGVGTGVGTGVGIGVGPG